MFLDTEWKLQGCFLGSVVGGEGGGGGEWAGSEGGGKGEGEVLVDGLSVS